MLSTVHEAPTVSSPEGSNRTSLASGNAHAGFQTFNAIGNSVVINSPPPPPMGERRSRTSVEVKASSPVPSSFHHPTSMAFSNTGPVPMPALMMTPQGPLQPATTGGSRIQFAPTPSTIAAQRDLGGATPRPGDDRLSQHSGSVAYPSPGPIMVQSPSSMSQTPDLGGSKTMAAVMQVSYSGGGPSTSVVGLVGSQSNGLQVFVPPGGNLSSNGSRVVSTASSQQRPVSLKDTRRVASSPSIHSRHFSESGRSQVQQTFQGAMSSSYHGHESVAGLSLHTGPSDKGKGKEVLTSEVPGAWTSTSGGGKGVMNGHAWNLEEDGGGASPSRAQSQIIRTHNTGMTADSQPYQPPLSAPPLTTPPHVQLFPPPKRAPMLRSMVMQRAMSETEYPSRPHPTHDARIQETGGLALKPAQRAFFGRHRHATERFLWNLGPEHDERVEGLLDWVDTMGWALANLGLNKFLSWRQRGALFASADFRPWESPEEPGFDWMTFDEVQNTLDKTLQESIATYDPATTALVFVFLVSKSGSSVAIWRRKVSIPPSLQLKHNIEIQRIKRKLAEDGQKPIIKVERPLSARAPAPISPPPPIIGDKGGAGKKRKKRKWWQFWKSDRDAEDAAAAARGKENVRPAAATRGKLAKRR